jgi:alkylation response protein AidB-like acyl-CoA dehydrogenase
VTVLIPGGEQLALARGVAEFLADQFPIERLRDPQAALPERWREFVQLGVLEVSLPERDGGMGLSLVDEVLVCREAGRYLVSPALVSSILATRIAARAGLRTLCESLLAGMCRVGIAMLHSHAEMRVFDADGDLCLLIEPQSLRLLQCGRNALRKLNCIDETVQLFAVPLPGTELATFTSRELVLVAQLLMAAMLCGQLEATRDIVADYARTRVQFGRPIGAFQAIKHRCADIALAAELCWSQTLRSAHALSTGADDAEFQVLAAKLLAGDEALKAARFNIQAHGGMGFTAEADAHRLMKRAHVLQQLGGDPRSLSSQLLDLTLVL